MPVSISGLSAGLIGAHIQITVSGTNQVQNAANLLNQLGVAAQGANVNVAQTGAAANQSSAHFSRLTDYVKRAAIAFAAFKTLDVFRDFVTDVVDVTKKTENFRNALYAALPAGQSFSSAMEQMSKVTRDIVPEWQQMQMATQLFASGLASTTEEAAKLANAGVILNTIFKDQMASWDRYIRLLQGGSDRLYDNYNLSKATIESYTEQIQATEGLSKSEARVLAVRKAVLEQAEKFKDSLGETTTATMRLEAAWQDYQAAIGERYVSVLNTGSDALTGMLESSTEAAKTAKELGDIWEKQYGILGQVLANIVVLNTGTEDYAKTAVLANKYIGDQSKKFDDLNASLDILSRGFRAFSKTGFGQEMIKAFRDLSETINIVGKDIADFFRDMGSGAFQALKYILPTVGFVEAALNSYAEFYNKVRDAQKAQEEEMLRWNGIASSHEEIVKGLADVYNTGITPAIASMYNNMRDVWDAMSERVEEALDSYREFVSSLGDILSDMSDLEEDYHEKQRDAWEKSNRAAVEAGDERADAVRTLNDKLAKLEQERVEKIEWVRSGAWQRTQEEEAEAEAYWNGVYAKKRQDIINSYKEQVLEIEEGEREKQAAAAAAAAEAQKEYEKQLQHMKLVAALTILEINGLLPELIGPVAKSAEDAAKLIESGIIEVDPAGKLAQYLAAANEQFSQVQQDAKVQAETNAQAISDAMSGKIESDINPAVLSMGSAFDTTVDTTAKGAVVVGNAMDGVELRIRYVKDAMRKLGPEFAGQGMVMLVALNKIKKDLEDKVKSPLNTIEKESAPNTATSFNTMWENSKTPLEETSGALNKINDRLKDIIDSAKKAAEALSKVKLESGGAGSSSSVPTSSSGNVPVSNTNNRPVRRGSIIPGAGYQSGGAFVVPPGYPNDSYPILVESGELVSVVPKNKVKRFARGTPQPLPGGGWTNIPQQIVATWTPVVQSKTGEKVQSWIKKYSQSFADFALNQRRMEDDLKKDVSEYEATVAEIRESSLKEQLEEQKRYQEEQISLDEQKAKDIADRNSRLADSLKSLEDEKAKKAATINDKLTKIDEDRKKAIEDLNAISQYMTDEMYAYELAKIENTFAEKMRVQREANAAELAELNATYAEKAKALQIANAAEVAEIEKTYKEKSAKLKAAYDEQIAIIKQGEAAKLEEQKKAFENMKALAEEQLKSLKLRAALTVMEMTGTLDDYTNGLAKTADEAATLIESGLLPISDKFAKALATSMKGLSTTTAAATQNAQANQKIINDILSGAIKGFEGNNALVNLIGGSREGALGALNATVAELLAGTAGSLEGLAALFGISPEVFKGALNLAKKKNKNTKVSDVIAPLVGTINPAGPAQYSSWPVSGYRGYQRGGDFIVPPGYMRDNFPVYVSSGERVQITPADQVRRGGTNMTINVTGNWNPQTEGDLMRYLKIINLMR